MKKSKQETIVTRLYREDALEDDLYQIQAAQGDLVQVVGWPIARQFMIGQLTLADLSEMN